MKTLIVIPARLQSTRLPRKMLLAETGRTLIEHTYRAAKRSRKADAVIVAADDQEIVKVVRDFGGEVMLTSVDHRSGSDRVAEVAAARPEFDLICNVQGDEPELSADAIDLAIETLERDTLAAVSTLAAPIRSREQLDDPNCVKVVLDQFAHAMYFSRSPLPYPRNFSDADWQAASSPFLQHIGLYVYRRQFLEELSLLPVPPCEQIESLEQLRVLYSGDKIAVGRISHSAPGIDTAEDYAAFVRRQRS